MGRLDCLMGPKYITCLEDKERFDSQRRSWWEDGDRDNSALATKQGRKAATRSWQNCEQILSYNLQGSKTLSAPWFWTSVLHNCERIHFYCVNHKDVWFCCFNRGKRKWKQIWFFLTPIKCRIKENLIPRDLYHFKSLSLSLYIYIYIHTHTHIYVIYCLCVHLLKRSWNKKKAKVPMKIYFC